MNLYTVPPALCPNRTLGQGRAAEAAPVCKIPVISTVPAVLCVLYSRQDRGERKGINMNTELQYTANSLQTSSNSLVSRWNDIHRDGSLGLRPSLK